MALDAATARPGATRREPRREPRRDTEAARQWRDDGTVTAPMCVCVSVREARTRCAGYRHLVALDAATARGNSGRVHSYSTRISRVTHLCPLCEVPSTISAGHLVAVRACSLPSSLSHARHARAVERFRCYRLARLPHPIALARPCTATRALGTSCSSQLAPRRHLSSLSVSSQLALS